MGHPSLVGCLLMLAGAQLTQVSMFAEGTVTSADCTFENDFCDWTQATDDNFNWKRRSGGTPSGATGPTSAKQGAKYAYIEASGRDEDQIARLKSPEFSTVTSSGRCMKFWYSMYGITMGYLKIYQVLTGGSPELIWNRDQDQGNGWHEGLIDLTATGNFHIQIDALRGPNYRSDMAIDGIAFTEQKCNPTPLACGVNDGTKRSMNGELSELSEWPWQVKLKTAYWTVNGTRHKSCGGAIIDNQFILTAAHCTEDGEQRITNPSQMKIWLGYTDIDSYDDSHIFVFADQFIVHESRVGRGSAPYDIMLVKLQAPIVFTDAVRPICLPETTDDYTDGTTCVVSGWGIHNSTSGSVPQLKHVEQKLLDNGKCATTFGTKKVFVDTLCAGDLTSTIPHNTCPGDSGGPLVCKRASGEYFQAGVVSFGPSCVVNKKKPSVYCDVSMYTSWIASAIAAN